MAQMTVISGVSRRRRWSEAERRAILAMVSEPGAVVADVARRADVSTSLIYKWRQEERVAAIASTGFAPAVVVEGSVDGMPGATPRLDDPAITIEFKACRVQISASASVPLVTVVLRALR
jgi:transposase